MPLFPPLLGRNRPFFRAQPKTRLPGGHTNLHGGGIPQKKGLFFSVGHFFPRAGTRARAGFFRLFWCTKHGLKPLFSQNIGGRRKSFFLQKIAPTAGFPGFSPGAKKVTFCDFPESGHFLHTRARGRRRAPRIGVLQGLPSLPGSTPRTRVGSLTRPLRRHFLASPAASHGPVGRPLPTPRFAQDRRFSSLSSHLAGSLGRPLSPASPTRILVSGRFFRRIRRFSTFPLLCKGFAYKCLLEHFLAHFRDFCASEHFPLRWHPTPAETRLWVSSHFSQ